MATKDVQPLTDKQKPMLRQFSADESVHELLMLLRNQEDRPDKALLNDTKCLLSLSLDRSTMPPLPSIKSKATAKQGPGNTENLTSGGKNVETSDDEVTDATHSPTFPAAFNTSAKKRLPSLGSREEAGTTSISKTKPQARKDYERQKQARQM